jgi:taurine dioxygenase
MTMAHDREWRETARRRGLGVEDLSMHTGTRLSGIDMASVPDQELIDTLKAAVAERVLLLFPDQQHLTPGGYVDFAGRFDGVFNLHSRRDLCLPEHHEVFLVGNVAGGSPKVGLNWHTDDYHLAKPGLYTFLHAIEVPPVRAGTTYANGVAAYDALPKDTRERIEDVRVRHSRARLFRELFPDHTEAQVTAEAALYPDVVHRLVRVHPVSGRKGIYLGGEWGSEVEEMPEEEGHQLYRELLDHMIGGEFTYTHDWREGDVLFSDNRCSLHRASEWDTEIHRRCLHRIILWDKTMPPGSSIAA